MTPRRFRALVAAKANGLTYRDAAEQIGIAHVTFWRFERAHEYNPPFRTSWKTFEKLCAYIGVEPDAYLHGKLNGAKDDASFEGLRRGRTRPLRGMSVSVP